MSLLGRMSLWILPLLPQTHWAMLCYHEATTVGASAPYTVGSEGQTQVFTLGADVLTH